MLSLVFGVATLSSAASDFVSVEGTRFKLNGGDFFFGGANCYDLFTYGSGSGPTETQYMNKTEIDEHMQTMSARGVNVLRTDGFNHGTWHGFEPALGEYNEAEFDQFDYIAVSARKHSIKLIVTLENYWADYGGVAARLRWENATGEASTFFTNDAAMSSYKNYVRYFITRANHYTNVVHAQDPTIMAWEVMNEPRYSGHGDDKKSKVLRSFMDDVGSLIKSIAPQQLISSGIEGHGTKYGYGGNEGNDFVTIHQSKYIDFCSVHLYPTASWLSPPFDISRTIKLLNAWAADAKRLIKKPLYVGEFNVDTAHGSRSEW
jgi:endo-1,4-beta-mannosidase